MNVWVALRFADLFETMLLVLGGKRPLFLHVLHHSLLLLFAANLHSHESAFARWLLLSNLVAQYCLYSYLSPFDVRYRPCFPLVCFCESATSSLRAQLTSCSSR